jgi:retron-type reverse transcriptase
MDDWPANADCADVWNHDATLDGLFDDTRNKILYYQVGRSLLAKYRSRDNLFPSCRRIRGIV